MNKKICALIGARSGSKGVPNKNVRLLNGFPLLAYPITAARLSKYIDRVILSTNDDFIGSVGKRFGAEVPFLRPQEFAEDGSTDYDWINHTLQWLKNDNYEPDILVHLRATTPLINPTNLDQAILYFMTDNQATSLRSAHTLQESPYKMFVKDGLYFKSFMQGEGDFFNKPRQSFPTVYAPNGYVDVLRREVIESGSLHGNKILAFETEQVIEVDTEQNLIELQKLSVGHRLNNYLVEHFNL